MFESARITEDGVALTKRVEQILGDINKAAASSHDISQQIARFSEEQAKSAGHVLSSIQNVTSMSESINKATAEQSEGIGLIVKSAENMKEISNVSRRATEEQSLTSKRIAEAMENAVNRTKEILQSVEKNSADHELLTRSIGEIQHISRRNHEAVSQMNTTVKTLSEHADMLKEELSKFKF